jgi:hypothetical protein
LAIGNPPAIRRDDGASQNLAARCLMNINRGQGIAAL